MPPEKLLIEFEKYKEEILGKTHRSPDEFYKFVGIFGELIELIPFEEIKPFIGKAKEICPDANDVEYFALALKYNCSIWSNDKALKRQSTIKVLSTSELLELLK